MARKRSFATLGPSTLFCKARDRFSSILLVLNPMKKSFVSLGLLFVTFFALSGTAHSSVGSGEWIGDTVGRADGPNNGVGFLNCGSNNYITRIKFRRYRGARDADYYTFAIECRYETSLVNPNYFAGYRYEDPTLVSSHVLDCGGVRPIEGIGMLRYRKIRGDYDTYAFDVECAQPTKPTVDPYSSFVGSTRGSRQGSADWATCSRSGRSVMNSFAFQRFRESRRDYDTYRIRIGCL